MLAVPPHSPKSRQALRNTFVAHPLEDWMSGLPLKSTILLLIDFRFVNSHGWQHGSCPERPPCQITILSAPVAVAD
jgi:hypothetical protein